MYAEMSRKPDYGVSFWGRYGIYDDYDIYLSMGNMERYIMDCRRCRDTYRWSDRESNYHKSYSYYHAHIMYPIFPCFWCNRISAYGYILIKKEIDIASISFFFIVIIGYRGVEMGYFITYVVEEQGHVSMMHLELVYLCSIVYLL